MAGDVTAAQRYYFAARYSRHPEMRSYRDQLVTAIPGAVVTSRWVDGHPDGFAQDVSFTPEFLGANPETCWINGRADIEDLLAAHTIVTFTGDGGGKGGRHIEHGYAIAAGKRLVVVGPRENIFHCHPATEVYATWIEFLGHESLAVFHPTLAAEVLP
jgi:hypothetical protein